MPLWMLAVVLACTSVANAVTWRVAQDGSGDFPGLLEAADAIASGDTLFIGAGEYDSLRSFDGHIGERTTCLPVMVEELTIIGDEAEDVLIGPASFDGSTPGGPYGIYSSGATAMLNVSGVSIRNCWAGVSSGGGGTVSSVRFVTNEFGLVINEGFQPIVEACVFDGNFDGFQAAGTPGAIVRECIFWGGMSLSVRFLASDDGLVVDCSFPVGRAGIQFEQGSERGRVQNCTFGVLESVSISLRSFSSAYVTDCMIEGASIGVPVHVERLSSLLMTHCFIGAGADGWSIDTQSPVTLEVRQCDILPGEGYAIHFDSPGTQESIVNMPLNYWGTTDPAEIERIIWDAADDSTINANVIYEPFALEPTPTEEESVGGLKGRYRSPK